MTSPSVIVFWRKIMASCSHWVRRTVGRPSWGICPQINLSRLFAEFALNSTFVQHSSDPPCAETCYYSNISCLMYLSAIFISCLKIWNRQSINLQNHEEPFKTTMNRTFRQKNQKEPSHGKSALHSSNRCSNRAKKKPALHYRKSCSVDSDYPHSSYFIS
jgi:hypothetical protein